MKLTIEILEDKMSEIRQSSPIRKKGQVKLGQEENDDKTKQLTALKKANKELITALENESGDTVNLNDLIKRVVEAMQNFQVFKFDEKLEDVLPAVYEKRNNVV